MANPPSVSPKLTRAQLARALGGDIVVVRAFEQQQQQLADNTVAVQSGAASTVALQDATVLTLSGNETLTNERILRLGGGLTFDDDGTFFTIRATGPAVTGGAGVTFIVTGETSLILPLVGTVATTADIRAFFAAIAAGASYANDAAAAGGGVSIGGAYRNGSVVQVRVT